jgi:hypothetical protein
MQLRYVQAQTDQVFNISVVQDALKRVDGKPTPPYTFLASTVRSKWLVSMTATGCGNVQAELLMTLECLIRANGITYSHRHLMLCCRLLTGVTFSTCHL